MWISLVTQFLYSSIQQLHVEFSMQVAGILYKNGGAGNLLLSNFTVFPKPSHWKCYKEKNKNKKEDFYEVRGEKERQGKQSNLRM